MKYPFSGRRTTAVEARYTKVQWRWWRFPRYWHHVTILVVLAARDEELGSAIPVL